MNKPLTSHIPTIAVVILVVCTGCAKAGPAQGVGFVNTRIMANDPALPFHKVWRNPNLNLNKYTQLYVADVNTSYMLDMTEWKKGMRRGDLERDIEKLSIYTKESIEEAFRADPNKRFEILEQETSDESSLIVEVAIIELVPSKVDLNLLGYAPFGVGLTIKMLRTIAKDKSTVAFEARLRDASTKEIVALYADREAEQAAAISVRGLSWYSHAHRIIDSWAEQFVKAANRKPDDIVKDTRVFTLKPW